MHANEIEGLRTTIMPGLTTELAEDDVFRINKCNDNDVWETQFLVNCIPKLKLYRKTVNDEELLDKPREFKKNIKLVKRTLGQLHDFCCNRMTGKVQTEFAFGYPNKDR